MGMFDGILNQFQDIAAKVGISPEQLKSVTDGLEARLAQGGDKMEALKATAAEHGISAEQLQGMLSNLNAEGGLLDKIGIGGDDGLINKGLGALDKDGDGNPINDLTDMAKGLFGKK